MFAHVDVSEGAAEAALTAVGVPIEARDGGKRFRQPCLAFRDHACSIYDRRPDACRAFACDLLKKHRAGEIDHDAALRIVDEAVASNRRVREAMAAVDPEAPRMTRAKLLRALSERFERATEPADRRALGAIFVEAASLDKFVTLNFGSGNLDW